MAFLTCEKSRKTMLFTDDEHGLMLKIHISLIPSAFSQPL